MRRITIAWILLFYFISGTAQEPESFADFNNLTYRQYEEKDWSALLKTGKQALKKGYDFYYMRMRMGIAAWERKNYHRAILHFRKALEYNQSDPVALEYLYYAYLFTDKSVEAGRLLERMPEFLLKKIGNDRDRDLTGLELSASYFLRTGLLVDPLNTSTLITDNGWRNMDEGGGEVSLRTEWKTGKNSRMNTGYRFLSKQRNAYLLDGGQGTYYSPNIYNQHFLYTDYKVRIFRDTYMKLSAGYLNLRPRSAATGRWGLTYIEVFPEHNLTGHLSLRHDFPYLSLIAGAGVSNLNFFFQVQQDAEMILYPLGNRNLYLSGAVTRSTQYATDPDFSHSVFGSAALGVRIIKPVWLEVYGSTGDRYNVLMSGGWHVYNEFNPISSIFGGDVLISFPKKNLVITAGYYQSGVTSWYFYKYQETLYRNEPIQYNLLNIYGGIKWTF